DALPILHDQYRFKNRINEGLEFKTALFKIPGLRFPIEFYEWFSHVNFLKRFILDVKKGFIAATQEIEEKSINTNDFKLERERQRQEFYRQILLREESQKGICNDKVVYSPSVFVKMSNSELMPIEPFLEYLELVNLKKHKKKYSINYNLISERSMTMTPNHVINSKIWKVQNI